MGEIFQKDLQNPENCLKIQSLDEKTVI